MPDWFTKSIEAVRPVFLWESMIIYLPLRLYGRCGTTPSFAQLAPTAFGEGNRLFTEFKGALTENFVLQILITQFEVKSESNTSSKRLKKLKELFPDKVKLRVRFSLDNLKLDNDDASIAPPSCLFVKQVVGGFFCLRKIVR